MLAVTATAATLKEAQTLAYEGVKSVHFDGMTFRKDIAYRSVHALMRYCPLQLLILPCVTVRSWRLRRMNRPGSRTLRLVCRSMPETSW